ncbi:MAG: AAA family ATPase [Actinobacteria bacterium]|nr:AAA family ATPase [Actinomycetota bacterium]
MSDYDDVPPEDPYEVTVLKLDAHTLIEQHVVGAAMRFPRAATDLQREVTGSDFRDLRLGRIFDGVIAAALGDEPVDYLTVWQKLAGWDVRGINVTDLSAWSDAAVSPSLGAAHAATVRRESMRRSLASIGATLRETTEDPSVAAARISEQLREIRDATRSSGKSVRWLREVLNVPEEDDAYDWVIPDLLERQDRLMLSAGEGVGKSTWLRQVAVLGAAGIHPFSFHQIEPVNALVVDAENSERQWRRAVRGLADTAATRGRRDPRDHMAVHCVPVMDITRPNDLGQVHRWIDEVKPDLLLLGPLYRVTKGSLNDDDDVAPVLAALDSIRERNVAMLIEVHAGHARSTSGERELRPRGSSALLGWPEFGLGIRRDKVAEGRRPTFSLVRWRGDRDRREWPTRMTRGEHQIFPWEPTAF